MDFKTSVRYRRSDKKLKNNTQSRTSKYATVFSLDKLDCQITFFYLQANHLDLNVKPEVQD
jgi:hypothetical protein